MNNQGLVELGPAVRSQAEWLTGAGGHVDLEHLGHVDQDREPVDRTGSALYPGEPALGPPDECGENGLADGTTVAVARRRTDAR